MKGLDVYQILKYLPHRYPFMMIDRVLDWESGKYLDAIKNVTVNEPHFTGHFPDQPVMPGVLIVEAMAQACGILTYLTLGRPPAEDESNYLVGIDNARFKRIVQPGDRLHFHVELVKSKRGVSCFLCKATVDGELACEAEIMNVTKTTSK
ncbi:MAG: 3-hydroxyacyl-ACP dehydratase FabZ [Gammaproteobacteria bacterium]